MSPTVPIVSTKTPEWINLAASVVQSQKVVALPFEKLFGLAANALAPAAVAKVVAIKKRAQDGSKPISVIIPDIESIDRIATLTPLGKQLAEKHWPGLLTLLLPAKKGLDFALTGGTGLIGVRLCPPCPAGLLAQKSGLILTATSANLSGENDVVCDTALKTLVGLDLIVEGQVEGPPGSSVVDASGELPVILRHGAVDI